VWLGADAFGKRSFKTKSNSIQFFNDNISSLVISHLS
jgi:hypothetical protein